MRSRQYWKYTRKLSRLLICIFLIVCFWLQASVVLCSEPRGDLLIAGTHFGEVKERSESELRKILEEAIRSKAGYVRIPPGTYRLKADPSGKAHLFFEDVHDMVIDAHGVELVMTELAKTSLIFFHNCSRITVRGLTVDCDPILFTQGVIDAIHPERKWYDVRIESGYETNVNAFGNLRPMNIFDPKTLEWKLGVPDIFIEKVEQAMPDVWRVYPQKHSSWKCPIDVGDPAVIPVFGAPGFTCRGCVDMVFEDCTIYQSGSMAFHEHSGGGNTTLRRCRVLKRPGSTRLLSTNADGFHCKNMRKGPTVEDCVFEGMHDDAINIHGMFGRVFGEPDGRDVFIVPHFEENSRPGDRIQFFSSINGASLGVFTVETIKHIRDGKDIERKKLYNSSSGLLYRFTLDRPAPVQVLDGMMCLNACGSGFVIRNNEVRPIRYRGFLIRTHNGLIEGNRITGCANDGITLTTHPFSEGPYNKNIIIRNNVIRHVGMMPYSKVGAGIRVLTQVFQGNLTQRANTYEHENILIEGNKIEDVTGDGIAISHARDVVVRNNRISQVGKRRANQRETPVAIRIENAEKVTQEGNDITNTAPESARIVIENTN